MSLSPATPRPALSLAGHLGELAVYQRDRPNRVWGWGKAHSRIDLLLEYAGLGHPPHAGLEPIHAQESADAQGYFCLSIPPRAASGPWRLSLGDDEGQRLEAGGIYFGELWLCSGQSNMGLPLERVKDLYREDIAQAPDPLLRRFLAPDEAYFDYPRLDYATGGWEPIGRENALSFSALMFFFARELRQRLGVAVGLLACSYGGAPAQAFIGKRWLTDYPHYLAEADLCAQAGYIQGLKAAEEERDAAWFRLVTEENLGRRDGKALWVGAEVDDHDWEEMPIPGYWDEAGPGLEHGSVWFRRGFSLEQGQASQAGLLELGTIIDADTAYVNGVKVGETAYQYPPRRYPIPAGILRPGRNCVSLEVLSQRGRPGFWREKPYRLSLDDGTHIDLSGTWKFRRGLACPSLAGQTFFQYKSSGLYNSMIHPALGSALAGVLWYQGESNDCQSQEYRGLLSRLIESWRAEGAERGNGDRLPFIVVQLPNWREESPACQESSWAQLREAQRLVSLDLKDCALACSIDLGEWNDLHPSNKSELGHRCALAAMRLAYGQAGLPSPSGPRLAWVRREGSSVRLGFEDCQGLLLPADGQAARVCLAAEDGRYLPALVKVQGLELVAWREDMERPAWLRYAWADNPGAALLRGDGGIPASPFQLRLP